MNRRLSSGLSAFQGTGKVCHLTAQRHKLKGSHWYRDQIHHAHYVTSGRKEMRNYIGFRVSVKDSIFIHSNEASCDL